MKREWKAGNNLEFPMQLSTKEVELILEGKKINLIKPIRKSTYTLSSDIHHGRIGNVFWIKEAWRKRKDESGKVMIDYKAGYTNKNKHVWERLSDMPRYACRLFLKIKNIKKKPIKNLTQKEIKQYGCSNLQEFIAAWNLEVKEPNRYHHEKDVWVIEFDRIDYKWGSIYE